MDDGTGFHIGHRISDSVAVSAAALEDVLGFDAFDPVLRAQLGKIFRKRGIPVADDPFDEAAPARLEVRLARDVGLPPVRQTGRFTVEE